MDVAGAHARGQARGTRAEQQLCCWRMLHQLRGYSAALVHWTCIMLRAHLQPYSARCCVVAPCDSMSLQGAWGWRRCSLQRRPAPRQSALRAVRQNGPSCAAWACDRQVVIASFPRAAVKPTHSSALPPCLADRSHQSCSADNVAWSLRYKLKRTVCFDTITPHLTVRHVLLTLSIALQVQHLYDL